MGSSGNLSEFLAARSGETADAVVDAVLQQVDRAAEWLPSAYEARRSMPTGMLERRAYCRTAQRALPLAWGS